MSRNGMGDILIPRFHRNSDSNNPFQSLFFLAFGIFFAACNGLESPERAAERFWLAVKTKNHQQVADYSTIASHEAVDISEARWRNIEVTFGEIRIKGSDATVETTVAFADPVKPPSAHFNTLLKKEQGQWKVDYSPTMAAVPAPNPLARILKKLEGMSGDISERLNTAIAEMENELPKIQKGVEELGNTFIKELEKSLEKQLPEIEKGIETFSDALNRALQEALKKKREHEEKEDSNDSVRTI